MQCTVTEKKAFKEQHRITNERLEELHQSHPGKESGSFDKKSGWHGDNAAAGDRIRDASSGAQMLQSLPSNV